MRKEAKERIKHLLPPSTEEHEHMVNARRQRKKVFNPMGRVEDINEDEILIADVRRHPIGIFLIYLQAIAAVFATVLIVVLLLPAFTESSSSSQAGASVLAVFVILMISIFAVIFLFVATKIYHANQLIVTSDNVTQIRQIGLFHRKVSEVSMENVEDVTAHQEGILSTIFNFGRVHIETAGEQDNYNFRFCPNPNAYAKAIQDARLEFIKKKHN